MTARPGLNIAVQFGAGRELASRHLFQSMVAIGLLAGAWALMNFHPRGAPAGPQRPAGPVQPEVIDSISAESCDALSLHVDWEAPVAGSASELDLQDVLNEWRAARPDLPELEFRIIYQAFEVAQDTAADGQP